MKSCLLINVLMVHALSSTIMEAKSSFVKGPPTLLNKRSSQKKAVNEGKDLKLTCPVAGNPEPIIEWAKGEEAIPEDGWERFRIVKDSLRIKEAEKEDQGTYVCKAVNGFGSVQYSYYVTVLDSFGSVLSSLTGDELRLDQVYPVSGSTLRKVSGQNVLFKCTAKGDPVPEITWLKNGHVIESTLRSQPEHDLSLPNSGHLMNVVPKSGHLMNVVHESLPLVQVRPEDSGNYTCLATNIHGAVTANWTLNVVGSVPKESPETFPLQMDNITSFSGDKASLTCRGTWDSGITPKVMWLKQVSEEAMESLPKNQTFPYMGKYYRVLQPTELVLLGSGQFMTKLVFENVQIEDSGVYFCTISNRYGINFRQASLTVIESDASKGLVLLFSGVAIGIIVITVTAVSVSICKKKARPRGPSGSTERSLIPSHPSGPNGAKLQPVPPSHQQRYVVHHPKTSATAGRTPLSNTENSYSYPSTVVHLSPQIQPVSDPGMMLGQEKPILVYKDSNLTGSVYLPSHQTDSSVLPPKYEYRQFDVI